MTVTTNICKAISARDSLSSLLPPSRFRLPSLASLFPHSLPSPSFPLPSSLFFSPLTLYHLLFSLVTHHSSSSTVFPLSLPYSLINFPLPLSLFPLHSSTPRFPSTLFPLPSPIFLFYFSLFPLPLPSSLFRHTSPPPSLPFLSLPLLLLLPFLTFTSSPLHSFLYLFPLSFPHLILPLFPRLTSTSRRVLTRVLYR